MRTVLVVVFLVATLITNAQKSTYLADLVALKSSLQNTRSFKVQFKGDKLDQYNALYDRLASDTLSDPSSYPYFYNLAQLLFPIRDNHLGFYQLPDYNNFKTKQSIDSFITTKEFLDYPTSNVNIDSLKTELAKKPAAALEGIYYYDTFYTVGLYKNSDKEYIGVILDSDVSLWRKGQIAIHLYEYMPHLYKAIYRHPKYKYFILQPIEKYRNQSLVNSFFYDSYSQKFYSKQLRETDHVNLPKGASKFVFRKVNDDILYLLVQTFQNNTTTVQASQRFLDSIKTSLKASHLILDLRNNEGGAGKEMKKYLKLLKGYLKNGHVYVLLNNGTLSQAEIFTLKLKQLKNVTTVGQTTKGMLTYGSNFGRRVILPSGRFAVYPTDMNNNPTLLPYEDGGINPDIILSDDSDWVERVVAIIKGK